MLIGTALWLYGFFAIGHSTLIDWNAHTPRWIAEFLPNMESELGMGLVLIGMMPAYWPHSQR